MEFKIEKQEQYSQKQCCEVMAELSKHEIVFPKGEAPKKLFELNEDEIREIGMNIFEQVSQLAAEIGESPVILKARS